MNQLEAFERNRLTSVPFSSSMFNQEIGARLSEAGLHAIASEIAERGLVRQFLAEPFSAEEKRAINSSEGLIVAEKAEVFQRRVQQVEVRESSERLVNLRELADAHKLPWAFTEATYHPACGEWAGRKKLFWVREKVSSALIELTNPLASAGFGLYFEDGFRPLGVQEGLFKRRYQMAKDENPEWTHDQLVLEARSKTAYTPRLAAHKGGAAVDIRIRDLHDGNPIDIGHEYPDGGALVAIDSPLVTQEQWQNRTLLSVLAERSGFAMYPFEDWHVCMGDATAAACSQSSELPDAIYGPVRQFDKATGKILEIYTQDELNQVFELA